MRRRGAGRRAGRFLGVLGILVVIGVAGGALAEWRAAASVPAVSPRAMPGWGQPADGAGGAPVQRAGTSWHRYVFPVAGVTSYARSHHDYPAADVLAPCGSPVRAVTDGIVLEVNRIDRYDTRTDDGAARGGLFVSILGDDGVRYYGSHLRAVAPGLAAGVRVRAGDSLGTVGDTGHAGACHLHFGISPACAGTADWWVRRGVVWPWPYLDSWRSGGDFSPAEETSAWRAGHGCPSAP